MYDLESRLIDFGVDVLKLTKDPQNIYGKQHLYKQLIRSSCSAALNYGESQGAESTKDFVHKMRLSLKELRESNVNLQLLSRSGLIEPNDALTSKLLDESHQLISIFVKSIQTAQKNA